MAACADDQARETASRAPLTLGNSAESDSSSSSPFDSLFALAQDTYFAGQFDSVVVLLGQLRARARSEAAVEHEARALTWLGLARWRQGELEDAWQIGQAALALKLEHALTDQLFRSYNALGLVAWHQSRNDEAVRMFESAAAAARREGNRVAEATVYGNLALVQTELGQFAEAQAGFESMRAAMARLDSTRLEGNALTNLGMLEIRLGNPNAAVPLLREALDRFRRIDYATGTQSALGQLGTAYMALGDPARALAALDSALVVARLQGLQQELASLTEAMAEIYRGAGDFRRALELYERAKDINAKLSLDNETGIDLRGEADIHVRLGDLRSAETKAREALAVHRGTGAPLEELRDLVMLAEVVDRLGRPGDARRLVDSAHRKADVVGARVARVEVALAEARIADRHRRSDDVLATIGRVQADLSRGGYQAEWEAQLLAARAHERLGQLDAAAAAGRGAVGMVERVRANLGSGVQRTAFVADKREVYAQLVTILLRRGEVEEAFEVADAARGRALLERLTATEGKGAKGTPDLEQGEILLRQVDALVETIDNLEELTPAGERSREDQQLLASWYARLERARGQYEAMLVRAEASQAGGVAFLGGSRVDAAAIRRHLTPDQLVLEYFVPHEGQVVLFIVSAGGVRALETAITTANLTSRVRVARDLVARSSGSPDRLAQVLTGLHDALIEPALRSGLAGGARELLVIPHDVLTYLPFAALRDRTTGRFLVERFVLRVLPSAAALGALGARPAESDARGATAFAPFPIQLPATRAEVRGITASGRVRRLEGRRASEGALRAALQRPQLVHVATHGVMNAMNPMFSRLELARASDRAADDGRLEIHELLGIRIAAPLVFLSGCETALGPARSTAFLPGEDYATLALAFLHAGAENVIATLWPVEDEAAAELTGAFYRELADAGPAEALARAQRGMLSRERHSAPFFWAGYQVAGLNRR